MLKIINISQFLSLLLVASVLSGFAPRQTSPYPLINSYVLSCQLDSEEPCFWYATYELSRCSRENRCDRLVIFFPDEGSSCKQMHSMVVEAGQSNPTHNMLIEYAKDGYIAVCASLYEHATSFVNSAHSEEVHRLDKLVESITSSPEVREIWTGEKLLYSGVGVGATAPVIAMAKTNYDRKESWQGDTTTAGCFYDGAYSVSQSNSYLLENRSLDGGACEAYRSLNICHRYYGQRNCTQKLKQTSEMQADSLIDHNDNALFSAREMSIRHWKLVACGESLPGCGRYLEKNVNPARPIQKTCQTINQSPERSCEFRNRSRTPHAYCPYEKQSHLDCRIWFNQLK